MHLARLNLEVEPFQRPGPTERLLKARDRDHRHHALLVVRNGDRSFAAQL
jgi:hypothetical protein